MNTFLPALVILTAWVFVAAAQHNSALNGNWANFKQKHRKSYTTSDEENKRRTIWESNVNAINKHNSEGKHNFTLKESQYTDMTEQELHQKINGYRPPKGAALRGIPFQEVADRTTLPNYVNWISVNMVTPVKNQEQCGSCWSFATTGVLEGQLSKATGNLVSLSEQQLVDCDTSNEGGCNGGYPPSAISYVYSNHGLDTESCYPYYDYTNANSDPTFSCRYSASCIGMSLGCSSYVSIPSGNEAALEQAVATVGPIAAAIDASHNSFQNYASGVYYEPACGNSNSSLDHAVLIVGYTSINNQPVWIVKNSWGTDWGVGGYIYMARNANNNCGIATQAFYPTGPFTYQ